MKSLNLQYEAGSSVWTTGISRPATSRLTELHRKGSHVKMAHQDGRIIVFPFHDEVDRYTLRGCLRDAGIDVAEFLSQVR